MVSGRVGMFSKSLSLLSPNDDIENLSGLLFELFPQDHVESL